MAKNDIAKDHQDITKRLLSQWKEYYSASNKPGQTSLVMNFDKQTLKQLEALGYVELEKDKSDNGNGAC